MVSVYFKSLNELIKQINCVVILVLLECRVLFFLLGGENNLIIQNGSN